jgi:hypothetical protein
MHTLIDNLIERVLYPKLCRLFIIDGDACFNKIWDIPRPNPKRLSYKCADVMLEVEPGWVTDQSWEFWRGRLQLATGKVIPEGPPRRSFDAGAL